MSIQIGHLAVTVRDMDKSLDFYTKCFGFRRVFDIPNPETNEPWIVYLYVGEGQFIELFYGGKNDYAWDAADRAYNHVCFCVDDMDATLKAIADAGYCLVKPPKVGCDGNRQAWINDPDGVRIEIMQLGPDSPQTNVIKG